MARKTRTALLRQHARDVRDPIRRLRGQRTARVAGIMAARLGRSGGSAHGWVAILATTHEMMEV